MRYGITVPNFGDYFSPRLLSELAREAEECGWDGFFLWDHMILDRRSPAPMVDPWVALSAIAMSTTRIRLGPLVTPVARRRPWKLARETLSLDHLADGRLVLGVGLGYPPADEFTAFGEEADDRVRAAKLDEGLEVLVGLWGGQRFSHHGAHYELQDVTFLPRPLQSPRIPIWVAGLWPNPAPFRRAARWDGVAPLKVGFPEQLITPDDVRDICRFIAEHRPDGKPFDVVLGGWSGPGREGLDVVQPFAEAGVTWWIEDLNPWRGPLEQMRERLRIGPPLV